MIELVNLFFNRNKNKIFNFFIFRKVGQHGGSPGRKPVKCCERPKESRKELRYNNFTD